MVSTPIPIILLVLNPPKPSPPILEIKLFCIVILLIALAVLIKIPRLPEPLVPMYLFESITLLFTIILEHPAPKYKAGALALVVIIL